MLSKAIATPALAAATALTAACAGGPPPDTNATPINATVEARLDATPSAYAAINATIEARAAAAEATIDAKAAEAATAAPTPTVMPTPTPSPTPCGQGKAGVNAAELPTGVRRCPQVEYRTAGDGGRGAGHGGHCRLSYWDPGLVQFPVDPAMQ